MERCVRLDLATRLRGPPAVEIDGGAVGNLLIRRPANTPIVHSQISNRIHPGRLPQLQSPGAHGGSTGEGVGSAAAEGQCPGPEFRQTTITADRGCVSE